MILNGAYQELCSVRDQCKQRYAEEFFIDIEAFQHDVHGVHKHFRYHRVQKSCHQKNDGALRLTPVRSVMPTAISMRMLSRYAGIVIVFRVSCYSVRRMFMALAAR